ncbi:MAG TPA: tetratricopeptide repeat protein [Solirubrobacteraceae bacterium]|nr:tetratricopeptide repeat protein [Solirubrobacteraceae bacterium]
MGRLGAAEAAYLHALASPAGLPCATAGLKRLERLDQSCAYADTLARDGDRQAAHAAYLQILAVAASSRCASDGLKATAPPSSASIWTTAGNVAKDAAYAIGAILLALLLVSVAILLVLQVQTRTPWLRDRWPAKKIRRPVFVVEPLSDDAADKLGSAVAGLIRGRVTWRTDRFGLNLVSGQAGVATAFSGLGDVSAEAKAAVAVITFLTALLPRRRFELTGQLQPAGAEGVGMSLELSQNGSAEGLISFWAASFDLCGVDAASAYQHLAVAAAAWVDIWMTKALDGGALLTGDPQSWAFFRSGLDAQRLGNNKRAQVLYEQALAADGRNVGAMANLGIIWRRAHRYQDAEEYLKRALPATEADDRAPHLRPRDNPDWYRIKYQFAALYTNWSVETEPGDVQSELADRATEESIALAETTLDALGDLGKGRGGQGSAPRQYLQHTLRPFLEGTIEPSVLVLVAGTVSPLPARPPERPHERPSREAVRASFAAGAIDPWQLISYVEKGTSRPPATLFNLACFYTRAQDFTMAAKRLLGAVRETQRQERHSLVQVALTDPVLRPLREKRPGITAKLYEMLDADAPCTNAPEMARHFDRQDRAIGHFRSHGWDVGWGVDTRGFDLTASKGSERLLVRLGGHEPAGDTIDAVSGAVQCFRETHPEIETVSAAIVVAPDGDYPTDQLASAHDRGVDVLRDTEIGFEYLTTTRSQPIHELV